MAVDGRSGQDFRTQAQEWWLEDESGNAGAFGASGTKKGAALLGF